MTQLNPCQRRICGNSLCWLQFVIQREGNYVLFALQFCTVRPRRADNFRRVIFIPGVGQVCFWFSSAFQPRGGSSACYSGFLVCSCSVYTGTQSVQSNVHVFTSHTCTSQWSSPCYHLSCTHGLTQTKSAVCWSSGPSFLALMLSLEMMHCWLIRAVNHNHTLHLLPTTRSKCNEW